MKLNKLFWALGVLVLPLGLASCGGDENSAEPDNTPYEYQEPVNKANAARFTFEAEDSPVQSVAFGETNTAVIQTQDEEDGSIEYVIGTYTKSGSTYVVETPQGRYTFAFQTEDPAVATGEQRVQCAVTTPKQNEAVTATASVTTSANTGADIDLFRTWYPFRTTLNLQKKGSKGIVTDELEGVDFEALKQRVEKEGCHIKEDLTGWKVNTVFFQGTGEFGVNFANSKSYYATWKLLNSNGDMDFDWKDKESIKNEFVKDAKANATVYKTGVYKGECWLRLKSEVEQDNGDVWDVDVIFRLIDHKR